MTSVDHPSDIAAVTVSVSITVIEECAITSLVDDGSVTFSAIHPIELPVEDYWIALPIL